MKYWVDYVQLQLDRKANIWKSVVRHMYNSHDPHSHEIQIMQQDEYCFSFSYKAY